MVRHECVDGNYILTSFCNPFHENHPHVNLFEEVVGTTESLGLSSLYIYLHDYFPRLQERHKVIHADSLHDDASCLVFWHLVLFEVCLRDVEVCGPYVVAGERELCILLDKVFVYLIFKDVIRQTDRQTKVNKGQGHN